MFIRKHLWMALSSVLLVVPAQAQDDSNKKETAKVASSSITATERVAAADPNYVIGAQDVLDISVWKEPELTRTVPVRPDGKISIPLLNDVQAAGLTPTELATQITESLKKFVTEPQVTVVVTQINSQRIYILGEVLRAGAYPLLPGMTVLQGLSSAGGFTQFASVKKIYVLRKDNDKQEKLPFNYKDVIGGRHIEQNIALKAGDTIVVP
jgi:polysaccharide export outer membrane protein